MGSLPHDVVLCLLKMIPHLGSSSDGEVIAAARAMGRILSGQGLNFCDFSEALKERLRISPLSSSPSRQPLPSTMASFCRDYGHGRLVEKEREFVASLDRQLACGRNPSKKQRLWLEDIYAKLQGGIAA